MLDHYDIRNLLEHLKEMDIDDFNQSNGALYSYHHQCACFGANAAYALGAGAQEDPDDPEDWSWDFEDGKYALIKIFALGIEALNAGLHRHGASEDPFSSLPWDTNPYDVALALYRERCQELGETPIAISI